MTVKVAITLDADWAPAAQLDFVHNLLREKNIKSTWFATDQNAGMQAILDDNECEVGIHPNFYPDGDFKGTQDDVVSHYLRLFPGVSIVRSHGLYSNGRLLGLFSSHGITADSSIFLPDNIDIHPYQLVNGNQRVTRMPFSWADDHTLTLPESERTSPLKWVEQHRQRVCLMFHPVHIYLNSRDLSDYSHFRQTGEKRNHNQWGIADTFKELLSLGDNHDYSFVHFSELLT